MQQPRELLEMGARRPVVAVIASNNLLLLVAQANLIPFNQFQKSLKGARRDVGGQGNWFEALARQVGALPANIRPQVLVCCLSRTIQTLTTQRKLRLWIARVKEIEAGAALRICGDLLNDEALNTDQRLRLDAIHLDDITSASRTSPNDAEISSLIEGILGSDHEQLIRRFDDARAEHTYQS